MDPSLIRWGSLLGPSEKDSVDLRLRIGARGDDLAENLSRHLTDAELSEAQVCCGRLRNAIRSAEAVGIDWRRRYRESFPAWMVAAAQRSLLPLCKAPPRGDEEELERLARLFAQSEWGGVQTISDEAAPFEFRRRLEDRTTAGRLHPLIEVLPGETGRLATRPGSFPVMSWTKGAPRRCLVSSFPGGSIVSLDFNAMDARSLLSLSERLREDFQASPAPDVYAWIAGVCFGTTDIDAPAREVVKSTFLRVAYGSSSTALSEEFGFSAVTAKELAFSYKEVLDEMPVRGKDLALIGQAASSEAFRAGLLGAHRFLTGERTRAFALFPVHDELLLDFPRAELDMVPALAAAVAGASSAARGFFPYRIKAKAGPSYGQLEEIR